MKVWFIVLVTLHSALSGALFGQASFAVRNLYTVYGVDAPVFDATGMPLEGPNYRAELWGSATADSLAPAVDFSRGNSQAPVPFQTDGYFISTSAFISILSVPPRGFAWLQVRAWDARLGSTYEEVAALGVGGFGESPIFYAQGGDPYDMLGGPEPLIGLQSFSLRPIPEPATLGLVVIGGLSIAFAVRRRRRS